MPLDIQQNIPLAPLTTLKIGGNARHFARAESEDHVTEAVEYARQHSLKLFILGGGSNVLISDAGFDGLVLQIGLKGIERAGNVMIAGAGEDWDDFVALCIGQDLAGVECLSGIPGLVGGTPVQNVGAYGQEVSETVSAIKCLDRDTGHIVELSNTECGFSYRSSIFNSTHRDRYVVLSVVYSLVPAGDAKIVYRDLIDYFGERRPSLAETRDAVITIRRRKSMVIEPSDPNSRSAGSFFRNPVVDQAKLRELEASYGLVPSFAFKSRFKIPAAWLIEKAGFRKGCVHGQAAISSRHTLALINRGRASSGEMIALKVAIQEAVIRNFAIDLVPEPIFVGFPAETGT